MSKPILTLLTDFGTSDGYVAQMKGAMLAIYSELQLVDVTHHVPPQDVPRAANILDECVDAFPEGTIHVIVVDPGVGSERRIVAAEIGPWRFVAPDNGVLSLVARRYGVERVVELTESGYWRLPVSSTFHGRDIMGPVAAHWSLGTETSRLGRLSEEALQELPVPHPRKSAGLIEGEVLWADSFGNLVTNVESASLPQDVRPHLTVEIGGRQIQGVRNYYGEVLPGEILALIGSSGRLEIAVNGGNAADELNLSRGDSVRVLGEISP